MRMLRASEKSWKLLGFGGGLKKTKSIYNRLKLGCFGTSHDATVDGRNPTIKKFGMCKTL